MKSFKKKSPFFLRQKNNKVRHRCITLTPFQPRRSDFKVFKLCDDDEMFHVARAGVMSRGIGQSNGFRSLDWIVNCKQMTFDGI